MHIEEKQELLFDKNTSENILTTLSASDDYWTIIVKNIILSNLFELNTPVM